MTDYSFIKIVLKRYNKLRAPTGTTVQYKILENQMFLHYLQYRKNVIYSNLIKIRFTKKYLILFFQFRIKI